MPVLSLPFLRAARAPFLRVLLGVLGAVPASLSYHEFADADTDAGRLLNKCAITLRQSETAHGLAWTSLPDDWAGGAVRVSALDQYSRTAAPAELTGLAGHVDPDDGRTVRLDFPADVVKPVGDWAFFARLSRGGLVDVTSGILVTILPDIV